MEIKTEQTELMKFDPIRSWAATKVKEYSGLKIAGLDDKDGYVAVHNARMVMKEKRVEVEKMRKAIKQYYLDRGRDVDNVAKEITALIQPIETCLEEQETAVDKEKERLKILKDRTDKLPTRIEKLKNAGVEIPSEELLGMDDLAFDQRLLWEQSRIFEERAKEQAEKEVALRREQEALAAEKKAVADKIQRDRELETARKDAAAKATADEQLRQDKLAAQARAEAERVKLRLGAEAAAAPDKEKYKIYLATLRAVPVPTMSTKKYRDAITAITEAINGRQ